MCASRFRVYKEWLMLCEQRRMRASLAHSRNAYIAHKLTHAHIQMCGETVSIVWNASRATAIQAIHA